MNEIQNVIDQLIQKRDAVKAEYLRLDKAVNALGQIDLGSAKRSYKKRVHLTDDQKMRVIELMNATPEGSRTTKAAEIAALYGTTQTAISTQWTTWARALGITPVLTKFGTQMAQLAIEARVQ